MPVLETLGGALFGAVLQVLFDRLDSRQVLGYFRGRKLDEKLLKKLKRKLMDINAVIDDAEQKQFSNSHVKAWLDEVRDALLDAEDLLDEINYEFSKCQMEAEFQTSASKVRNFESSIRDVLDDLESLLNQKVVQGLKIASDVGVESGSGSKVLKVLPQTSLVAEDVIYGRNDDKEMILNWLTSDTNNHKQLSILSIVGMGGMGKTTLAKHVYNDSRMEMEEAKFSIKAWICVSDEFDVFKLTKTILETINNSIDDSRNLEMVQGRLKEKLTERRFLLVLDDVWNEDRDQWKALQTPLTFGAKGSKILVTTRSKKVAFIMQSEEHPLKQLQEDHSWQVFGKHAFLDDNPQMNAELKEIGRKIVEKCKGLPLALETVGCLLRKKSSISEWEGVLISKIWDLRIEDSKILPALLLSYYHLPSHLKRCFAYCALFPKDHEFDKESLILSWMAENFLQCSQQSKSPIEVGEQYFDDLLSRSFFQQSSRDNQTCFVMHDFLNDLAKYVSGDICFRLGVDEEDNIPKTTRHFSFEIKDFQYFDGYESLYYAQRLRTFMPISRTTDFIDEWYWKSLIHKLFSKFKFLRNLTLSCCDLEEVPNSIGDLIHLCSLDLSSTHIKKLPDSTCLLWNLQILRLNCCFCLKELPSTLHKLTNLHRLELMQTNVAKVPMHLGKLKNLQVLMSPFIVGKSSELGIQQLGELSLHGRLSIWNLHNIVNPLDALAADLKNKTHLVGLHLEWDLNRNIDDSTKEREVLENLQPSRHLEQLSINNYGGNEFPCWLSDKLLNVVSLSLKDCKYCGHLPPLGLLPFLKDLRISGLDWVMGINAAFYVSSSSSFTSLETLDFSDMKEWKEWECTAGAFPSLQHLSIQRCPKLKGQLPEQLCQLKKLVIRDCKELEAFAPRTLEICVLDIEDCGKLQIIYNPTTLKRLEISGDNMEASLLERIGYIISDTSLESLSICSCPNMNIPMNHCYDFLVELKIYGGCDSLTTFPLDFFPKLHKLDISRCCNLQMISQGHPHNHLKHLSIDECPKFESFSNEGLSAPQLEWFAIERLKNLKSLPGHMPILLPSLTSLCIRDCPQVEFSDGCLPSSLKHMDLQYCPKLFASLKGAFGGNPSLESFYIMRVNVESFPDEGLLPLSLTTLGIFHCPNLKKLDYKGLCQLFSLKELILQKCPRLQCLPEEGLPKSISTLHISYCPLLTHRCKKPKGEDWGKIGHIKNVRVNLL